MGRRYKWYGLPYTAMDLGDLRFLQECRPGAQLQEPRTEVDARPRTDCRTLHDGRVLK